MRDDPRQRTPNEIGSGLEKHEVDDLQSLFVEKEEKHSPQERRALNAVWTISEKYNLQDFRPLLVEKEEKHSPSSLGEEESLEQKSLLEWAILGMAQKTWDVAELAVFIQSLQRRVSAVEPFEAVWMLALEEALYPLLVKERPAWRRFRQEIWQKRLQHLERRRRLPLEEDIRKAYAQQALGLVPKVHPRLAALVAQLQKASTISSSHEMVLFLEEIYGAFFQLEKISAPSKEKKGPQIARQQEGTAAARTAVEAGLPGKKQPPRKSDIDFPLHNLLSSAEFNPNDEPREDIVKKGAPREAQKKESQSREMALRVQRSYGRSLFSPDEQQKLEEKLCYGRHQFCRLHLTDGVLPQDQHDLWRREFLLKQRQENEDAFYQQEKICLQHIERLSQLIRQVILRNLEEASTLADRGRLDAGRIWRGLYLQDRKVFQKRHPSQDGKIAVDILMDASGSQCQQQEKVALQSYMIAEALSRLSLPCRVWGFNSFFDYTILRIFRDYNDPSAKNTRIFDYWASGSNRDGLALRFVAELMKKEEMEHRILIVLNDAKPNDVRPGGEALASRTIFSAYTGMAAVKDTAKAVRDLRSSGIAVLGIYTGQEEFSAEQQIYGKDFVRIHDVKYFSAVVGAYLQRQLDWMLEK